MAKKYTPAQYGDRLQKILNPKKMKKAIVTPFRKNQKIMRAALIAEYWKHPLGAKIWEWRQQKFSRGGGPAVKLGSGKRAKGPRWSQSNQAYVAPVTVKGMAALIERGGRLNRYTGSGDRRSSGAGFGTRLSRMPVMDRVIPKNWERALKEIGKSFSDYVDREL